MTAVFIVTDGRDEKIRKKFNAKSAEYICNVVPVQRLAAFYAQ